MTKTVKTNEVYRALLTVSEDRNTTPEHLLIDAARQVIKAFELYERDGVQPTSVKFKAKNPVRSDGVLKVKFVIELEDWYDGEPFGETFDAALAYEIAKRLDYLFEDVVVKVEWIDHPPRYDEGGRLGRFGCSCC